MRLDWLGPKAVGGFYYDYSIDTSYLVPPYHVRAGQLRRESGRHVPAYRPTSRAARYTAPPLQAALASQVQSTRHAARVLSALRLPTGPTGPAVHLVPEDIGPLLDAEQGPQPGRRVWRGAAGKVQLQPRRRHAARGSGEGSGEGGGSGGGTSPPPPLASTAIRWGRQVDREGVRAAEGHGPPPMPPRQRRAQRPPCSVGWRAPRRRPSARIIMQARRASSHAGEVRRGRAHEGAPALLAAAEAAAGGAAEARSAPIA